MPSSGIWRNHNAKKSGMGWEEREGERAIYYAVCDTACLMDVKWLCGSVQGLETFPSAAVTWYNLE